MKTIPMAPMALPPSASHPQGLLILSPKTCPPCKSGIRGRMVKVLISRHLWGIEILQRLATQLTFRRARMGPEARITDLVVLQEHLSRTGGA